MNGILFFFHCPANSGFAIANLERVFAEVGRQLVGSSERVHFAFPALTAEQLASPAEHPRIIRFDSADSGTASLRAIEEYVRSNRIDVGFGFDQPVRRPGYRALRAGGLRTFVSYWGAPMSGLNRGLKLALKRLDVALSPKGGPDHYIFESFGMQRMAVYGRGIDASRTSVTNTGIDPGRFQPTESQTWFAHDLFQIPRDRRIVYYSGHMEERKGVRVILNAAVELIDARHRTDIHFLFMGNRPGEESPYRHLYIGKRAEGHITFGGYRQDIERVVQCATIGAIASTGWDSFPMSAIEMAACGVPLVVSQLPGIDETVEDGETGFTFKVGDHLALADRLAQLIDDHALHATMRRAARQLALRRFTIERQVESLTATVRKIDALCSPRTT